MPKPSVRFCLPALLIASLASLACATSAMKSGAPANAAASPGASLPPLLDRELLFGDPEIIGARLSPDGAWMSFLKPFEGTRNLWVKRAGEPFDKARPLSADKRPISRYFWSRD